MAIRLGITLGDVTGIGPEITLKALARQAPSQEVDYSIIGDFGHAQKINRQLGLKLRLHSSDEPRAPGSIPISNPLSTSLPEHLSPGAAEAASAAVAWVRDSAQRCLRGDLDGVVTAPVNKESIIRAGIPFVGQTELLAEIANTRRIAMMLLGQDDRGRWLRVALATTHLPIKSVANALTAEKIQVVIELTAQACRDLGLSRARIGVCGLNPHAGEGGAIGTEELTAIGPAVGAAQQAHIDAVGPVSADALFFYAYRGDYDAVVAMYHDQGLAPLKMVAFERGVNWTLGLPFIRTSPDHGTAYDIAGKGEANPTSMVAAIQLAEQLAAQKQQAKR